MQPHDRLIDTYRDLVGQAVTTTQAALQTEAGVRQHAAVKLAATAFRKVPGMLADIDAELVALGNDVWEISTNRDLTDDARNRRITERADAARVRIDVDKRQVINAATSVTDRLRTASYPKRPEPADAAQEAALANLKADLRMLADPSQDREEILSYLLDALSRALAEKDQLTAWFLASSHWPEDYLRSRRIESATPLWSARVAEVLDKASPEDLAGVRRAYRQISDARRGLPLLPVVLNNTVSTLLNNLAGYRIRTMPQQPFPTEA